MSHAKLFYLPNRGAQRRLMIKVYISVGRETMVSVTLNVLVMVKSVLSKKVMKVRHNLCLCMVILCIDTDQCGFQGTLWRHIARLFNNRKQDGVIFVGTNGNKHRKILEKLEYRVSGMFRSNYPVIMPIKYSTAIQLKLDSHVIFYEKEKGATYRLLDTFSVKGGAPIALELGTWERGHGVSLKQKINRWDRRTNLFGAPFINSLSNDAIYGGLTYDKNGNITGSEGWLQDVLFYITDRLNLTVKTIDAEEQKLSWIVVDRKIADICTDPMVHNVYGYGYIPISIIAGTETLLAGVRSGTAPDAWVYIDVFGFWPWFAIISALSVIAIMWPILHMALEKDDQSLTLYEGVVTVSLFFIQNGDLPESKFWTRRILALATSMLTLLVFIYYCNDITSKMTAGPPPLSVRTFGDALEQDYEVIIISYYYFQTLRESPKGTSKHAIYKLYFERYANDIAEYVRWEQAQTEEEKKAGVKYENISRIPQWYFWTEQSKDWAADTIINDEKTLWFCEESAQNWNNSRGNVVSLKLNDAINSYFGFALQSDSEFMAMFNHFLLKAYENGILNRLDLFHNDQPDIKIGMIEPEPLGINNVMFPFSFLASGFLTSTAIAVMEKILKKLVPIGQNL